jgi:glycine oxidase
MGREIQVNDKLKFIGHQIVIVGGGIIGLTIARSLAQRGVRDICLLERSSLGTESSFAAAGMLAPQAEADEQDDFFKLLCQSRDLYPAFAKQLKDETGIDVELDTTGTLYLAFNEHDQSEIDQRFDWQTSAGLPVEKLTPEEARMFEPCVSPGISGALRFPLDFQVENRRLLTALANSVSELGVHLVKGTNVESIQVASHRVSGVQTSSGFIGCSTVVVATGAWSSFANPAVKVEPVRGQIVCLTAQPELARHVIYSPRGYIVPRQNGRLLAGSTSENAGFAKEVTAAGVNTILKNAIEIAPALAVMPISDTWAGLRPRAADGLPVLGPCGEIDGLVYATGHYRNGILLAPLTGELIAKVIVEAVVPAVLTPFSPDRFVLDSPYIRP